MKNNNKFVCIGQITAAHGIKGHVRLRSYTNPPKQLFNYPAIFDSNHKPLHIKCLRNDKPTTNNDFFICSIQNIADRNTADLMAGTDIYIQRQDLGVLAEDELYISDIENCAIYNSQNNEPIGVAVTIVNYGAGDILEVKNMNNELILVPFNKQYCPIIDIQNKKIFVTLPEYS